MSSMNEDLIREVYAAAEADNLDPDRFASLFGTEGYFLDMPSGEKWTGPDVRQPVVGLATAFPDLHRQLLRFYSTGDVVVVELKLQGTHREDLPIAGGVLPASGKTFDVPCCDVFHVKDGKVLSFHCYNMQSIWLDQLGALHDLDGALRR